jgi:hypothetical protein
MLEAKDLMLLWLCVATNLLLMWSQNKSGVTLAGVVNEGSDRIIVHRKWNSYKESSS